MMYFFEYGDYESGRQTAEREQVLGRRLNSEEIAARAKEGGLKLSKKQLDEAKDYTGHGERLCERADDLGLLHAYNDTWLEVRTWNNDIRGILTLFGLSCYWMAWSFSIDLWADVFYLYSAGHRADGSQLTRTTPFEWLLTSIAFTVIAIAFTWVANRFFMRYEWPTQRWIRLRFNRKTKKVYLLRPRFAGGLMVFDWRDTQPSLPKKLDPDAPCLMWQVLAWQGKEIGQRDVAQVIGRRSAFKTDGDWMAFWEFIRRYMEEGPQAVPQPKRVIGHWPSLREAWISVTQWFPSFRNGSFLGGSFLGGSFIDALTLLMTPLILLIVAGNFIGQCLTWQARFPREIERAGRES